MAKYSIDWLEQKTTGTGKSVKNATLKTENGTIIDKVSFWGDFPDWASLAPGKQVECEIRTNDKGYRSAVAPKVGSYSKAPSGAVSAATITSKSVEEAQKRKNDSIAFFNATNSSITLVTSMGNKNGEEEHKVAIVYWRDWFLEEWKKYESGDLTDKRRAF